MVRWIKSFNAECVVMGGNITRSAHLFLPEMDNQFKIAGVQSNIYVSSLGDDGALLGSARLCDNEYYNKLLKANVL